MVNIELASIVQQRNRTEQGSSSATEPHGGTTLTLPPMCLLVHFNHSSRSSISLLAIHSALIAFLSCLVNSWYHQPSLCFCSRASSAVTSRILESSPVGVMLTPLSTSDPSPDLTLRTASAS